MLPSVVRPLPPKAAKGKAAKEKATKLPRDTTSWGERMLSVSISQ